MHNYKLATAQDIEKYKKTIGSNIQYYRVAKNLSQQDLGEIIGVSASSIGAIEVGKCQPKIGTLLNIAIVLGVNPKELYALNKEESPEFTMSKLELEIKDTKEKDKLATKNINAVKSLEKDITVLFKAFKKGIR